MAYGPGPAIPCVPLNCRFHSGMQLARCSGRTPFPPSRQVLLAALGSELRQWRWFGAPVQVARAGLAARL